MCKETREIIDHLRKCPEIREEERTLTGSDE